MYICVYACVRECCVCMCDTRVRASYMCMYIYMYIIYIIYIIYIYKYLSYLYNNTVKGTVLACHKEWASNIQKMGGKSANSNKVTKTVNVLNHPIKCTWELLRLKYHHNNVIAKVVKPKIKISCYSIIFL